MPPELSSWRDTPTRRAIEAYISAVTDEGGSAYVPPQDRIATFDNDGTLWCERPAAIQLYFALEQLKKLAQADPALLAQPAYKAAADGDMTYFDSLYPGNVAALMQIVFATHGGMTQAEFEEQALAFLTEQRHPRFGVPFKQLVYKPMVELLRTLEAHDFRVFIASAGGMSFMRTVAEDIYGIPRERVIGSNVAFELRSADSGPVLYRLPGLIEPLSDGPGKPANIELHIGRKPILTGGNANGDIEMLWYSETSPYRSLQLFLQHDDDEREYAYAGSVVDRALETAGARGWTVISMRDDWETVF
ncbi:MAG TPA: HAD family hydrolase [Candidatus Limnocylindrales bacterium]|nr:HAD family hydrolase [Candidatus Limnocylindrales bacterium]